MRISYKKALYLLNQRGKFFIKLELDRILNVLQYFGNPQDRLNVIQIAGTNGKGSVSFMLSKTLNNRSGLKVGLYTSPHIFDFVDRIKINGKSIPKNEFSRLVVKVLQACKFLSDLYLTQFEILTCVMFLYFYEEKVDIAIIETGLGGRFDATNVCLKNMLSVITSISIDHKDRLGDTIEKIAFEKAGIIKSNGIVFLSENNTGRSVIEAVALKKNAKIFLVKDDLIQTNVKNGKNYVNFGDRLYEFGLKGQFQQENINLVYAIFKFIAKNFRGYGLNEQVFFSSLKSLKWPCRFEMFGKNVILDGAHNVDAMQKLLQTVLKYWPNKDILFVYGCISTKEYEKILNLFNENSKIKKIYFYDFKYESSVSAYKLSCMIKKERGIVNFEGLKKLISMETDKIIVICGSFYMLSQIIKKIKK